MPLATKNNALIVKDGKVAENCGCCGWYCSSAVLCPCNYSKSLPLTLNATLGFALENNLYGIVVGGFTGSLVACYRLTPEQAAQLNGTYTLSYDGFGLAGACRYRFQNSTVDIRVVIGKSSGAFNYETLHAGCVQGFTSVHIEWLGLTPQGMIADQRWQSNINAFCGSIPNFANNAASRTYTSFSQPIYCPTPASSSYFISCGVLPSFPVYNSGFRLDGAVGGRDVPACQEINLTQINHAWNFDVVYTDTSGSHPAQGRISRAVSLTVTE